MLVALALEPPAQPDLAQQVHGRLLEDAGPDREATYSSERRLDHDRLDTLAVEQVGEQQPGRPGPDDRDLRPLLLHGSSTADRVTAGEGAFC